jgi:nitric oxide reductase NorQ protein/cobaltochelatase CobS
MTLALIIESVANGDFVGTNQTLVVPNYGTGKVDTYHRVSTGSRGRADTWTLTDVSTLPTDTYPTHQPVAIRTTSNDIADIRTNRVTQIAVKAINARNNSTVPAVTERVSHQDVVSSVVARLAESDSSLGSYLLDKRITNSNIEIEPLVAGTPAPSVQVSETPAPKRELVSASAPLIELASVPDIKWSQKYINRKVIGDILDFDVLDVAMQNDQNVLIKGHAGSGKTMCALAYASARGHRYYNVSSHIGVEPSQLFGKWNPTSDGHFAWQDGAVTDLVRNGGVLLLNEVNFLPERVSTVIFSLLDDRREIQLMDKDGEIVKAHPDLLVIADMNPNYRGTRELNQAFNDRFAHHLEFPYDPSIEKKLIPNSAIRDMASQLRVAFESDELTTPISTRSLVAFTRNIETLGLDYAVASYVQTFPAREQQPVKLVLDTHRFNIEQGLGIANVINDESERLV